MQPSVRTFAIAFTFVAWLPCVSPATGRQLEADGFELSGKVINAATGESVSGALVQLQAPAGKVQFSSTDGTFAFTNLPRGRYSVTVRKPGFFSEQELGRWNAWMKSSQDVPFNGELVLKLTPEAIIYGEVKNENGEPIEGVTARVQSWQMENGRRQLHNDGHAVTDDEGNFRIAELKPGSYRVSFVPTNRGSWVTFDKLSHRKEADQGYSPQFYPGVADAELAAPIELHAGAKIHITQALSRQRLFEVAGVVRGANVESGLNLMLVSASGDMVQKAVRINPKTGEFQIPGIPAGTYRLSAMAPATNDEATKEFRPPLTATQLIHLNSDLTGVVLTLGRGLSAVVRVYGGGAAPDGTGNVPQVMVRLISKEFPQYSPGALAPPRKEEGKAVATIDDISPGTYTVEAYPHQPGYIAAIQCGSLDLLRDELTVVQGAALPPIEVTLRNDGAQLRVAVVQNGQPAAAAVVLYSEEYPRRSLLLQTNETGTLTQGNLPPGKYQLAAVNDVQDLDFQNPISMEKYLNHASEVTLRPGDQANVRVEVQEEHQ